MTVYEIRIYKYDKELNEYRPHALVGIFDEEHYKDVDERVQQMVTRYNGGKPRDELLKMTLRRSELNRVYEVIDENGNRLSV